MSVGGGVSCGIMGNKFSRRFRIIFYFYETNCLQCGLKRIDQQLFPHQPAYGIYTCIILLKIYIGAYVMIFFKMVTDGIMS